MRFRAVLVRTALVLLALAGATQHALAQQSTSETLSGTVALGFRSVDTSGAVTKYREDINLDDGVRLFDLAVSYRPATGNGPVDYVDLTANNLGGDPFEAVRIDVRKFGAYKLRLDRRRSEYFYEDAILPAALASITGSTGGDFHHFDFERIRESAALDIELSPATALSFGLERQRREGDSTTTLDIQRDEFELEKPLDESSDAFRFGVQHAWQRVSLIIEESVSTFENTSELFLPGASPGQNTTDQAALQFFRLDQSYDYDSRGHLVRIVADPTDRLDLRALWRLEDVDLDMRAAESSAGTDFASAPFATSASGPAKVRRESKVAGLDLGYRLETRARLVAAVRSTRLDQNGALLFGTDQGTGHWAIDTDGYELGAEIAVMSNLLLAGGWSSESRDTDHAQALNAVPAGEALETDRDGYFLRLLYTSPRSVEFSAAIEDNSIDDPFTLASPSDSRRYKASVRYAWDNGLSLNGSYKRTDVENDTSSWAADTRQADLRVSYGGDAVELSAGYSEIDLARSVTQNVTGGTLQVPFAIVYGADSSFFDVSGRWTAGSRFALGGSLRGYENDGSFPLERDDWRAFVEFDMTDDYTLQLNYRGIDYVEEVFDDYDANIVEIAVRLDW